MRLSQSEAHALCVASIGQRAACADGDIDDRTAAMRDRLRKKIKQRKQQGTKQGKSTCVSVRPTGACWFGLVYKFIFISYIYIEHTSQNISHLQQTSENDSCNLNQTKTIYYYYLLFLSFYKLCSSRADSLFNISKHQQQCHPNNVAHRPIDPYNATEVHDHLHSAIAHDALADYMLCSA